MAQKKMDKTKVLCLGLSDPWLSEWMARDDVSLVGVVDIYDEIDLLNQSSRPLPKYWNKLDVFDDIIIALNRLRPDIVTIVTPPDRKTPREVIEIIVNMGYDVCLEKFRPADPGDGEKLLRLSERSGRNILVGEICRYDKDVERIRQMIDSGVLGKIEEIVWRCHRPLVKASWMEAYHHVMLEDLTYHHLGVFHYLFNFQCSKVYARSYSPAWSIEKSPGVVSMIAESKQGVHLNYYSSWAAHGKETSWLGEFRIEGSDGSLHYCQEKIEYVDKQGEEHAIMPIDPYPHEYHKGIIHSFLDTAQNQTPSELKIERFFSVIQLIYAAVKSAESGKPIILDEH